MALNEDLDFEGGADATVKGAFIREKIMAKELLPTGTRLYKWTQFPLAGKKGITPWWSFADERRLESGIVIPGIKQSEIYAERLKVSQKDFARAQSAVTKAWNQMDNLLMIVLLKPVWGFIGRASGQNFEEESVDPDKKNVFWIGGAYQVWIPNLTTDDVKEI